MLKIVPLALLLLTVFALRAESDASSDGSPRPAQKWVMRNGFWVRSDVSADANGLGGDASGRPLRNFNSDQPFAIYFAGRTPPKAEGGDNSIASAAAPRSVWENPAVGKELERAGIGTFIRLYTDLNLALAGKYGARDDTLVICATDGAKLASFSGAQCKLECISEFLKTFHEVYTVFKAGKKK